VRRQIAVRLRQIGTATLRGIRCEGAGVSSSAFSQSHDIRGFSRSRLIRLDAALFGNASLSFERMASFVLSLKKRSDRGGSKIIWLSHRRRRALETAGKSVENEAIGAAGGLEISEAPESPRLWRSPAHDAHLGVREFRFQRNADHGLSKFQGTTDLNATEILV
jgi:hypothetical protein